MFGVFMSVLFIISQSYYLVNWYIDNMSTIIDLMRILFDYFNAMFSISVFLFISKYLENVWENSPNGF